jgi:peptidoglycan/xylan/chitin deacetylase (PgdA/CDA1 family)
MSYLPDHYAARRTRERDRRRRARARRRIAAAGLVVAAALAVALVTPIGTTSRTPSPQRAPAAATALGPLPARLTAAHALDAREERVVRRLIALGLPVYCGGHHGREVALTFDDGPGVYTHYAVRKLAAAHERATFFVVGKSIVAWPGWLRRELRVAVLGDHTWHHLDLDALAPAQVYDEIESARALIERDTRLPVFLFRPPYGAHDAVVDATVRRLDMIDVLWSVDSADSLGANYAGIIHNVAVGLRPGAIIEMHENRGQTIRALTTLLPLLHRRHLRSVSVLQLLADDPPTTAQLRAGEPGCGRTASLAQGVE